MAKRFIDTELFRKGFVKSLDAPHKLLWLYLLCECDHAGIWEVELDVASLRLGFDYDPEVVAEAFKDRIVPIKDGQKWFIPDFIRFQYGTLNPAVKVHQSAIKQLEKYNCLETLSEELENSSTNCSHTPLQGVKDKDKEKDKDRKGGVGENQISWSVGGGWHGISEQDRAEWKEAYPACDLERQLADMQQWLKANPAKARKTNWRQFITNWLRKEQNRGGDLLSPKSMTNYGQPRNHTGSRTTGTANEGVASDFSKLG